MYFTILVASVDAGLQVLGIHTAGGIRVDKNYIALSNTKQRRHLLNGIVGIDRCKYYQTGQAGYTIFLKTNTYVHSNFCKL